MVEASSEEVELEAGELGKDDVGDVAVTASAMVESPTGVAG